MLFKYVAQKNEYADYYFLIARLRWSPLYILAYTTKFYF
jgi:hypothetical protein